MTDTIGTDFGQRHFATAQLGDRRRTASLVDLANRLARHPGGSLPQKFGDPLALRRCYDLMNTPAVTHAAILEPHRQQTFDQLRAFDGVVLVLHDTTELDLTSHPSLHDQVGPIGDGRGYGYECHNSLAVAADGGTVFGLVNQILHRRAVVPPHETGVQRRERESRESRLWVRGIEPLEDAPPGRLWIDVCDRGGDTFEFLAAEAERHRHYIVRSKHNRRICVGHAADGPRAKLHSYLRTQPGQGRRVVTIHDHDNGARRSATLTITWAAVRLRLPKNRRGEYTATFLDVWGIRVWEEHPPAGVKAVEWFLVTDLPVDTAAAAWEKVDGYLRRWILEEYHKGQKTGCAIEDPQFTTTAALEPMIALLSVVTILLLNLRDLSRRPASQEQPAATIVDAETVAVLSGWRYGEVRRLSVREFVQALARLGGHLNRKKDKTPGWLVLWRGWTKLQLLVEGYRVGQRSQRPKTYSHNSSP